jgi:hypothetical protein
MNSYQLCQPMLLAHKHKGLLINSVIIITKHESFSKHLEDAPLREVRCYFTHNSDKLLKREHPIAIVVTRYEVLALLNTSQLQTIEKI